MKRVVNLSVVALLFGCTTTIVKKPDVELVQKVAVVSVYADPVVRNEEGGGVTSKVTSIVNTVGANGGSGSAGKILSLDAGGTRLVDAASAELKKSLARVNGWQVVDASTYVGKPFFKQFVKHEEERRRRFIGKLADLSPKPYVTAGDLAAVQFIQNDRKDEEAVLKQLIKDIGCDSLAIELLSFSYAPSTSVGGNGTAMLKTMTELTVINREGAVAVKGKSRDQSEKTVPMVMDSIALNESSEAIYQGLIRKAAHFLADKINDEK
jgi:hypothetical protein